MNLTTFHTEVKKELDQILSYWETNTLDNENGGFIGTIDWQEWKNNRTEKGAVLNARILWTFSAAYAITKKEHHKTIAERAFSYFKTHFFNPKTGGVFWSVDVNGYPKETKNQIYALAFAIYGCSEYYKISQSQEVLNIAIELFHTIETHSYDKEKQGYLEAFTENWHPIEDLRLSKKDINAVKTMNTHLHIVEGYANLYLVWKDNALKSAIKNILNTIDIHFLDKNTWYYRLFFTKDWKEIPDIISYGHDIEAAWLLQWCAEAIEDTELIKTYREYAIKVTDKVTNGLDADGGLWYEYNLKTNELVTEKHWWPQAESMIGFFNTWQLTQNTSYLDKAFANWNFTKKHIIDHKNGEWIWGIDKNEKPIKKNKVGFWKCPYHNSRFCIEIIKRLNNEHY